jgi:hypothetical protein
MVPMAVISLQHRNITKDIARICRRSAVVPETNDQVDSMLAIANGCMGFKSWSNRDVADFAVKRQGKPTIGVLRERAIG